MITSYYKESNLTVWQSCTASITFNINLTNAAA